MMLCDEQSYTSLTHSINSFRFYALSHDCFTQNTKTSGDNAIDTTHSNISAAVKSSSGSGKDIDDGVLQWPWAETLTSYNNNTTNSTDDNDNGDIIKLTTDNTQVMYLLHDKIVLLL
jgi:hypothetical protein